MKKSILFLVNIDTFFVSHRIGIAKKLLELGFDVHIVTNFVKYEKKLLKDGFIVHQVNFKRNSFDIINTIACILKIFQILYKIKPDIFHLISIRSILIGGLASLIVPVKSFVFSVTGIGSTYLNHDLVSLIRICIINFCLKLIFLRAQNKCHFIFQNKDDLEFVKKIYRINKKKITIIKGSGVFIKKNKFVKIKNKIPVILMASRLIADKGVNEYIEAIKICKKLNFKGKFILIGDPDPGNPSKIDIDSIKKYHKSGLIKYLSFKSNILKFIIRSSIIVLPSYREGLPKILIEAASEGRPVITTNVPGCRDAIINRRTGILIPAKNSKALATAIMKIAFDKNLLNKMGKVAFYYAKKNFNIIEVEKKHIQIYNKLL